MAYYYLKEKRPITKSQKIAWFAGFFDGEGSVMIIRRGNHTQPLIAISSTDKFALEEAQAVLRDNYIWSTTFSDKRVAGAEVRIRGEKKYTDKVERELGLD